MGPKLLISEATAYEMYDDFYDEVYGNFMGSYPASRVLKAVDPIAYQVDFHNYVDSLESHGYTIHDDL